MPLLAGEASVLLCVLFDEGEGTIGVGWVGEGVRAGRGDSPVAEFILLALGNISDFWLKDLLEMNYLSWM